MFAAGEFINSYQAENDFFFLIIVSKILQKGQGLLSGFQIHPHRAVK